MSIDYLSESSEQDIYIQTWSGNERMLSLAKKLGFRECRRKKGIRTVRGKTYDGLMFLLDRTLYDLAKQK